MKPALIAALICAIASFAHANDSPSKREVRALNAFFVELHPGMTQAAFERVLSRYQFKDGVMFMPIICSIHDPSRHFDIPGHGVYAFDFDRERKLSGWHRWTQNGPNTFRHDSGTIQATFTITPATTSNRMAKPKRAKRQ